MTAVCGQHLYGSSRALFFQCLEPIHIVYTRELHHTLPIEGGTLTDVMHPS